jgi:hypothetical protein
MMCEEFYDDLLTDPEMQGVKFASETACLWTTNLSVFGGPEVEDYIKRTMHLSTSEPIMEAIVSPCNALYNEFNTDFLKVLMMLYCVKAKGVDKWENYWNKFSRWLKDKSVESVSFYGLRTLVNDYDAEYKMSVESARLANLKAPPKNHDRSTAQHNMLIALAMFCFEGYAGFDDMCPKYKDWLHFKAHAASL